MKGLYDATRATLAEWTERLAQGAGAAFPEKFTASREGWRCHGRFASPARCAARRCAHRVRENETNYAPAARPAAGPRDRALSRLLKASWPRSIDEIELEVSDRR